MRHLQHAACGEALLAGAALVELNSLACQCADHDLVPLWIRAECTKRGVQSRGFLTVPAEQQAVVLDRQRIDIGQARLRDAQLPAPDERALASPGADECERPRVRVVARLQEANRGARGDALEPGADPAPALEVGVLAALLQEHPAVLEGAAIRRGTQRAK